MVVLLVGVRGVQGCHGFVGSALAVIQYARLWMYIHRVEWSVGNVTVSPLVGCRVPAGRKSKPMLPWSSRTGLCLKVASWVGEFALWRGSMVSGRKMQSVEVH